MTKVAPKNLCQVSTGEGEKEHLQCIKKFEGSSNEKSLNEKS